MWRWVKAAVRMAFGTNLVVGLAIVGLVSVVISLQIANRSSFANSELRQDVMDRWGAPIEQPAPSVRYVASGSVFQSLVPLPLDQQSIAVDATMNYRKRGLYYFSGFDLGFRGDYQVENHESRPIDLVFVFPIQARKNQVLLSDLTFTVNGEPAPISLSGERDRLVWTGRAQPGERLRYQISFRGRGLESFVYRLDPHLKVKGFRMAFHVTGGANYDYPAGVVPASAVRSDSGGTSLSWEYGSLESGVPVGLVLPSEKAFDSIIGTMVRRSWAPFIPFFLVVVCLGLYYRRPLAVWQASLVAAWYGLFFVLLAYLAAFMEFHLAYMVSLLLIGALLLFYVRALVGPLAGWLALGAVGAFLLLPTVAVILQGYTGLVYTLEIALGLAGLMIFTTREAFRRLVEQLLGMLFPAESTHAF
jgi:hypothetical protein